MSERPLLEVQDVTRRFGGIVALDDVSFDAAAGEIVGLIGPNGAGKTTAFNVITRVYTPDSGSVVFDGNNLLRTPLHRVVRRGIARTFQNLALFPTMTVRENVLVGAHARRNGRNASASGEARLKSRLHGRDVDDVLDYVGVGVHADRRVAGLPFGTQKRVETARALASAPRLLLLDEPAGGLNHEEVEELGDFIRRIRRDFDLTIVLVEHHMNLVMGVADRVHVLDFGRRIASGTPAEVQRNPDVIQAYLGS